MSSSQYFLWQALPKDSATLRGTEVVVKLYNLYVLTICLPSKEEKELPKGEKTKSSTPKPTASSIEMSRSDSNI